MASVQKIVPHLWFEDNVEEAVNFYVSLFGNSAITNVARYGKNGPGPVGSVMAIGFTLEGQSFAAINGGKWVTFNGAVSLLVHCDTQNEIDRLYDGLLEGGGKPQQCGWLSDRYGVVWQINYAKLSEMLADPDADRAARVMRAMLSMRRIDIAALDAAYRGR